MNNGFMIKMIFLISLLASAGCAKEEVFPPIGLNLAGPTALEVSDDGKHFYVLNADFERSYNRGSLLILDAEGNRLSSVEVPRLGRSLTVAGNRMLLTFEKSDEKTPAQAWVFDVTDPEKPEPKASFILDACSPLSTTARKDYDHFALACRDGTLYLGTFAADLAASTLTLVRNYGGTRGALYIDPVRELLFAFSTDLGKLAKDEKLEDKLSYDETFQFTEAPNDIPDLYESSKKNARLYRGKFSLYRVGIYDIAKEREAGFPGKGYGDISKTEMRWMYFSLSSPEGWPDDVNVSVLNPHMKNYVTNFWAAEPDPLDPDSFYLSHRGNGNAATHANNIVKVSLIGPVTDMAQPTNQVMSFERVYGFKGEVAQNSYPSDFKVKMIDGQKMLLVNHFRDLINWVAEDRRYAIDVKALDGGSWSSQAYQSSDYRSSYYQLAINSQGRGVTLSFYGNSVIVWDLVSGSGIQEIKTLR